jgi:hypothetical protein
MGKSKKKLGHVDTRELLADWVVTFIMKETMMESTTATNGNPSCVIKLNGIMEHYGNLINREATTPSSIILFFLPLFFNIFYVTEMACYYCVNVSSNEICNRYAIERPCPTG